MNLAKLTAMSRDAGFSETSKGMLPAFASASVREAQDRFGPEGIIVPYRKRIVLQYVLLDLIELVE